MTLAIEYNYAFLASHSCTFYSLFNKKNVMKYYELAGTYGSHQTPCTVLIAENSSGAKWYCVDGSKNINRTYDEIGNGVDVEDISDFDVFTAGKEINTLDELEEVIND